MKKRICAALLAALGLLGALSGCGAAESQTDAADAALHATVGTWKTAQTLTPYFYEDFVPEGARSRSCRSPTPATRKPPCSRAALT